jgi:hypothetical protein
MLSLLVSILVACIVFGLIWWVLTLIPLPPPFGQVVRVVCAVIFAIWLIYTLLGISGTGFGHPLLR